MSSEIIQSIVYDKYDYFQMCQLPIFKENSFHYFEDYLMTKRTLGKGILLLLLTCNLTRDLLTHQMGS